MYRIFILLFFSLSLFQVETFSQKKREGGFFLGTSYYLGEINPVRQFYAPSPSFGALFKFYFNDRHCLRFHGMYGQFRGNDVDFPNEFQQQFRQASFSATLFDINAIYEFNFLPFRYNERKTIFSPFLFGGLGYDIVLRAQNPIGNHFTIPFGTGVKYMVSQKVTIGLEWSFRKTFRDNIDGLNDPGKPGENSLISNKDWYSFAGFFITFRLFDNSGDCPVYQQKR